MYGYLPLPDLGSSRNQNLDPSCQDGSGNPIEGCDANFFTGLVFDTNGIGPTVVGRFPWRTLGTAPLRDGHGECLWLIVSSLHSRIQRATPAPVLPPMNWDTLGQLDIVIANGTNALNSALTGVHDRPVAIIYAPGPPLPGQDRGPSATDDVTQCGGNYNAANYLDPAIATALGGVTNYLGLANNASGNTGDSNPANDPDVPKPMLTEGRLFASGGNYLPNACTGASCDLLANDAGLRLTTDHLFSALRKNANFRTDINSMLDRMVNCLRDEIANGGSVTNGKIAGANNNTCYGEDVHPLGYYPHWREMVFVTAPASVNATACAGALLFAGQRAAGQQRITLADKNSSANYLESANLSEFTAGTNSFAGPTWFDRVSTGGQTANQDIVRCIPNTASYTVVSPFVATSSGSPVQLASYAPATRTLTLGSAVTNSNFGSSTANLYACAWTPETHASGTGFRSYFRFRIRQVGEGFTFAIIDGDRNNANVCGAARQHLGYSGNNGVSPYIQAPKLAIEFDTARNSNFSEPASLSNGRNDPCYQSSCGSSQNLSSNAHIALVYWGYDAAHNTAPVVTQFLEDDNVHGFPWPPDTSARPAPHNPYPIMPYPTPAPVPAPGVAPLDRMGATSPAATAPAKREFHARVEVTRSFIAPSDPKDATTGIQVQFWIEPHSATNIAAMTYNAGTPPTLSVTAASHGFSTGDIVVIKDAVPTGFNGEYPITVIDSNNFTATLPTGTQNPGKYISFITWSDVSGVNNDLATVTSPNHGLNTGDTIAISGAIPTEYNGMRAITRIDADTYKFILELSYEPGDMPPAIAAAKSLTPQASALANTTRPMSQLYAGLKPFVSDTATIYDEQMGACAINAPFCPNGQSCGSDNMCYRPALRNLRLGFTIGERVTSSTNTARGQLIEIKDQATTWIP
jgi:hypothetical protein